MKLLTRDIPVSISTVTSHGELLLIATCMSAAVVGELIASGRNNSIPKLFAGGGCVIVLLLASLYFADVSASITANQKINLNKVSNYSIYIFIFSIITSGLGIILVELDL